MKLTAATPFPNSALMLAASTRTSFTLARDCNCVACPYTGVCTLEPSTEMLLAESRLPAMNAPDAWKVLPASTKFSDRAAKERFCPAFCGTTPGVSCSRSKTLPRPSGRFCTSWGLTLPVTSADAVFTNSAPAAETVTCSDVEPSSRLTSTWAGCAVSTSRSVIVVVLNPGAEIVMVYRPAGSDWKEYTPSPLVLVWRAAPVFWLVSFTTAPGNTAPIWSDTVPVMEVVVSTCANALSKKRQLDMS